MAPPTPDPAGPGGIADLGPLVRAEERAREQRAWYWYDWANSAYVTTITTVLFAPYLTALAKEAAVDDRVQVLGIGVAPVSLAPWVITVSTILSALLLPPLGALVDRTARKKQLLAGFAWAGAAFGSLLFFATGTDWALAAVAVLGGNLCLAASLVVNDAILPLISEEHERDRVSSRGWAWGYLGGGLLLALNLALVTQASTVFPGTDDQATLLATRVSMLSAALWWAGFTLIPFVRLRRHPPRQVVPETGGVLAQSFGQLAATLRDLRRYPVALTFLLAYLFFNDGIQTVIGQSSQYGAEELGFDTPVLIATILMVQFVAFGGALLFGRAAGRFGAKRSILVGLGIWMLIVTGALFLPRERLVPFLLLGFMIGVVLGGTQALARSYFSLLIPRGKEAEYFSFYHAMDRGTSWFGSAVFAVVAQLSGSLRPAIFALIVFFLLGGLLLLRVDTERGIREAGNDRPPVV